MPHINRLRVNNVKYNFGTQYYDDFMMKPYCKNMLYDLANGGGKSVLMLLLLQTVIPNCTLDDKQPVEKLFRTSQGSSTIHSLIEWKLNDNHIKDGFQYMTTGFCARKGTSQEEKETASIDYFNYCIFYREYNENDIRNLPLVNENERVTYSGLKQYLKDLQRNPALRVEIFDRKGEYQQFISNYGIYESEWEIIRGINKTEGHVRTYFETNYKTTRKVVEDLLIEEIIQKSYQRYMENGGDEETMAGTLLSIKDKLVELSQKKSTVSFYDRQVEIIDGLKERLSVLDHVYGREQELFHQLHEAYAYNEQCRNEKKSQYESLCLEQNELTEKKRQLEIIVEAAKMKQNEKKRLTIQEEISKLTKEITLSEDLLVRRQRDISLKESMNDYLEYLQEKRNRDELKQSLEAIRGGSKVEASELHALASNKKRLLDNKLAELKQVREQLLESLKEEEQALEDALEQRRTLDIDKAVKENQYTSKEEELVALREQINQMRKGVSLLFIEEINRVISQVTDEVTKNKQLQEELNEEYDIASTAMVQAKTDLQLTEEKLNQLKIRRKECEDWLESYKQRNEECNRILGIYQISSKDNSIHELEEQYRTLIAKIIKVKEQIKVDEQYLRDLKEKNLNVESEGFNKVREYLQKRYKDQVMTGTAYLKTLDEKARERVLRKIPLLPYAIIVMENYEDLLNDRFFRRKDFGSYAIPILNLEELKKESLSLSKQAITFAMKEEELFYKEERMAEEESIVRAEIVEERENLNKYEEQESILKRDIDTVRYFLQRDCKEYEKVKLDYEQLEKEVARLSKDLEKFAQAYEEEERHRTQIEEQQSELKAALFEKETEIGKLVEIEKVSSHKALLEAEQKELLKEEEELQEQYNRICNLSNEWKEKVDTLKKQVDSVDKQVASSKEQWTTLYQPYYEEDSNEYEQYDLSEEELDARFLGKKDAFEKEYSDLGDKERLLNSYINSMNRCLKAIAKRKISISDLEEMRNNHTLTSVTEDVLQNENVLLQRQEQTLLALRNELEAKRGTMHQLEGMLGQALVVATEKFGKSFEQMLSSIDENTDVGEQIQALTVMNQQQASKLLQMEESQQSLKTCEEAKLDMERIYRQMDMAIEAVGVTTRIENISVFVKNISKSLEAIVKEVARKRDEFGQQLLKTASTLELLKAHELAYELRQQVKVPSNLEESDSLKTSLEEVCNCIRLERTRVEQGLEDMERIKKSFENQCLQRCDNVKVSLERLPKLSKIVLDHEQIPMIGLSIPYVKEELQQQRMSDYIDSIVAGVDKFEEVNDKIKYIKAALSLKRLFAVIVTDMNRIKLTLYKRERIKEQSRHLRYEEAVGSTGQSQGIYIQFLIAIINYITYMNSGSMDNTGLRKVIFIDNPFGAAKDVYIWEPIFELLKMNQVQLIVPARGTTPAITGKFDVNYVLGQRLSDKKQQTVVVDYHSNIDTTETEYIPLQYEQTSLF